MDKIYYLWLEILRESNAIINCEYIKENISNSSIIALFKGENVIDEKLNNSIVKSFLDKNIKERTIRLYNKIEENKLRIITREEKDFPKRMKNAFCIITNLNFTTNLNNKNVYIYYANYYSKVAKSITKYNYEVIKELDYNLFCEYEEIETIKIDKLEKYLNNKNEEKYLFDLNNYIFYIAGEIDILSIIDMVIIIEAQYEGNIVEKVNYFVEKSIPILVFPNSIFNKNSYFSNYLIKQGADIALGKSDILFALKSLSCWHFLNICYIILNVKRGDINGGK